MIDIYHSRRGKYKECKYWIRDESSSAGDLSEYVLKNTPKGAFYAQETTALSTSNGQLNNLIVLDEKQVNLATNDNVEGMSVGSVVLYLGHLWIVVGLQQEIHLKESEFGDGTDRTTYISIRR